MKRHEYIAEKTFEYLDTTEVKASRFYLQPKTHKEGYRATISTNGHPTERISGFLDYHIRPFATSLPSYVQDTTDYLSKTKQSDLPENTLLLTMDVESLHTNIPHDEGIEACKQAWDTRVDPDITTTYLVKLLIHVLKLNNLSSMINTTSKSTGQLWAPTWPPHMPIYSWENWKQIYYTEHPTSR
jgi:hypothetical protein